MGAVTQLGRRLRLIACIMASAFAGCDRINSQPEAESRFANDIAWWMRDYESQNPGVPITNLVQVFGVLKDGYPYLHHRKLADFGKSAGFTASLAEKYVFFWPRFTNEYVQGEVACMSAQPLQCGADGLSRIYIAKESGNYIYRSLPEERVQAILRDVKPRVVKATDAHQMPPLPPKVQLWWTPALADQYEKFVWDLSSALGQDSSTAVRLGLKVVAGLLLVLLGWLWFWLLRKRSKRNIC
jgi:hypothetical protein